MTRKLYEWIPATEKLPEGDLSDLLFRRITGNKHVIHARRITRVETIDPKWISRKPKTFMIRFWNSIKDIEMMHVNELEYLREADPVVWPGDKEITDAYIRILNDVQNFSLWKAAINWVKQQMENKK